MNIFENQYQYEVFPYAIDESCCRRKNEATANTDEAEWMTSDEIERGASEIGIDGILSNEEGEMKARRMEDFVQSAMEKACAANPNYTFNSDTWQLKDRSGHFIQLAHGGIDTIAMRESVDDADEFMSAPSTNSAPKTVSQPQTRKQTQTRPTPNVKITQTHGSSSYEGNQAYAPEKSAREKYQERLKARRMNRQNKVKESYEPADYDEIYIGRKDNYYSEEEDDSMFIQRTWTWSENPNDTDFAAEGPVYLLNDDGKADFLEWQDAEEVGCDLCYGRMTDYPKKHYSAEAEWIYLTDEKNDLSQRVR